MISRAAILPLSPIPIVGDRHIPTCVAGEWDYFEAGYVNLYLKSDYEGAFFISTIAVVFYIYLVVGVAHAGYIIMDKLAEYDPNCPSCAREYIKNKMKNCNDLGKRTYYYQKLLKNFPKEAEHFNNPLMIYAPLQTIGPASKR